MPFLMRLTRDDTQQFKGLALLLLLVHHLFYQENGLFDDIPLASGMGVVSMIGRQCKICVALFVFLSGYGLEASSLHNRLSLGQYFRRRFFKLFPSYWIIWALFVPIGVFVFGISFNEAYGSEFSPHFVLPLVGDILGINDALGLHQYNSTWWFMSCIIVLYLLFPLFHWIKRYNFWALVMVVMVAAELNVTFLQNALHYIPVFVVGMVMASGLNVSDRENEFPASRGKMMILGFMGLCFVVLLFFGVHRYLRSAYLDYEIPIVVTIVILHKLINLPFIVRKSLGFIGTHSMNIFLFHTFIYGYWWPGFIYAGRNPFFIFIKLLLICLALSIAIEWGKRMVGEAFKAVKMRVASPQKLAE